MRDELGREITEARINEVRSHSMFRSDPYSWEIGLLLDAFARSLAVRPAPDVRDAEIAALVKAGQAMADVLAGHADNTCGYDDQTRAVLEGWRAALAPAAPTAPSVDLRDATIAALKALLVRAERVVLKRYLDLGGVHAGLLDDMRKALGLPDELSREERNTALFPAPAERGEQAE